MKKLEYRLPKFTARAAVIILAALLCLSSGCSSGENALEVTADNYERELYKDDTAITITVVTPDNCTALDVSQLGGSPEIYGDWLNKGSEAVYKNTDKDPLYYTEIRNTLNFTAENASVSDADGKRTWTVTADFGKDGVYGLLITAHLDSGKDISQESPVYVRYPEVNIINDGAGAAWIAYILQNSDEPFYFTADVSKTSFDYKNVAEITEWGRYIPYNGWNALFCSEAFFDKTYYESTFGMPPKDPWEIKFETGSPVYGECVLWESSPMSLNIWSRSFAGELTGVYPIDDMTFPTGDVILSQIAETETERVSPSARAAVCYLYNAEINAEIYPEAALCLEKSKEVLAEIIKPDMTDFEKVKAIHDRMLELGRNVKRGAEWDTLDMQQKNDLLKSAYGFMSGYGGDCMGWSDTFYMLCTMSGVSCSPVSAAGEPGGAVNGGFMANHSFNVAMIEGEVYYFDVYWDGAGSGYDMPPYTYFCMTTEQAAKSHTWFSPENMGPPTATDTTYLVDAYTGELLSK